jgi:hypothetical protein
MVSLTVILALALALEAVAVGVAGTVACDIREALAVLLHSLLHSTALWTTRYWEGLRLIVTISTYLNLCDMHG